MDEKTQYLAALAVVFVIVLLLIVVIGYAFNVGFLVSDDALIRYMIENEQLTIFSAKRLKARHTEPKVKALADDLIAENKRAIRRLKRYLNQ